MLRPLAVDVLQSLAPLAVGLVLFLGGRKIFRGPSLLRYLMIGVAISMLLLAAASLGPFLSAELTSLLSLVGGGTIFLCWLALLFLGIVWGAPSRTFSSVFLVCLIAVAGLLLVIESSGWIVWRFVTTDLWQATANDNGSLIQSSGMTCSPASAVMLLHHHGITASEGEMAYLANTSIFGTEPHAMARALTSKVEHRGWHAEVRTLDYDAAATMGLPFVAHIQTRIGGHAVFVEKLDRRGVSIIDPVDGNRLRLSRKQFEDAWQGILITIVRD